MPDLAASPDRSQTKKCSDGQVVCVTTASTARTLRLHSTSTGHSGDPCKSHSGDSSCNVFPFCCRACGDWPVDNVASALRGRRASGETSHSCGVGHKCLCGRIRSFVFGRSSEAGRKCRFDDKGRSSRDVDKRTVASRAGSGRRLMSTRPPEVEHPAVHIRLQRPTQCIPADRKPSKKNVCKVHTCFWREIRHMFDTLKRPIGTGVLFFASWCLLFFLHSVHTSTHLQEQRHAKSHFNGREEEGKTGVTPMVVQLLAAGFVVSVGLLCRTADRA